MPRIKFRIFHCQLCLGRITLLLAILAAALTHDLSPAANAQPSIIPTWVQTAKLIASDGAAGDAFGSGVAIEGDTVVVGAYDNNSEGAVYVFQITSGGVNQVAKLTASDGASGDQLGFSVAIDGNTIVAGAPGNNSQGAVYVFVEPSGGWSNMTQTAKLTASDGASTDAFGNSVAISGTTIVAGAPGPANSLLGQTLLPGAAYVFVEPSGGWTNMTQTAELTASDAVAGDRLGWSVAISGGTVLAGAPGQGSLLKCIAGVLGGTCPLTLPGGAYFFLQPSSGWSTMTQTAKLTTPSLCSGSPCYDLFGDYVGIDGGTAVVGATFSAYLFVEPLSGWSSATETAALSSTDNGLLLGSSVVVVGNTILAGGTDGGVTSGEGPGAAYIFLQPSGGWSSMSQTSELTASDGTAEDDFGSSVGISGNTLVVGADQATFNSASDSAGPGAAYLFSQLPTPNTTLTATPNPAANGATVTLKVTVAGSGATPTGTVTFYDGGTALGPAVSLNSSGVAQLPVSTLPVGTDSLTASYSGDANYSAAASNAVNETILAATPPSLTSPSASPVSGLTTFAWSPGIGSTDFELRIGTTGPGSHDIYSSGELAASVTSEKVTIPANGVTLYVRLYYLINSAWSYKDYTFTEGGSPTPPTLTSPTASPVSGSTTFAWSPGIGSTDFELRIGTTGPGSHDIYSSGELAASVTSENVTIPANGVTLYVRLYYLINSAWSYKDYTFTEGGNPTPPTLTSPSASPVSGLTTFTWNPGIGSTDFELRIGTTGPGSHDIYSSGELAASVTSENVTIPANGVTLYVRLYYMISGTWAYKDYTFTEG